MSEVNSKETSESLEKEYDTIFDGEEKVGHTLLSLQGKFKITELEIPMKSIIIPTFKKKARQKTITGLTSLVEQMGVLNPIHVMTLEDVDEDEPEYSLLEGTRRVFAGIRAGKTTIKAFVWDFENKDDGRDIANMLSLVLNRSQKFSASEQWDMLKILESINECTPGTIEFLLQLNSGEAMKLKDIMLAEGGEEVDAVRQALLDGELNIEGAYKKICNIRKKDDRLKRDDARDLDTETFTDEEGDNGKRILGTDEVKELLDMADDMVADMSFDELSEADAWGDEPHVQDVKDRTPIDKSIKDATLKRDNFTCQCCGLNDEFALGVLVYHHKVPVFAGGYDSVDNGLTLCANCHMTLHNYVDSKLHGKLENCTPERKETLTKIFKYGYIAIQAAKRMHLSKEKVHELDAPSRMHMFPDANIAGNEQAYRQSLSDKAKDVS